MSHDCVGDEELNYLCAGEQLCELRRNSEMHGPGAIVAIHKRVDEIIEPNHPNHVGVLLIEGDECKVTGEGVVIPMHEHQRLLPQHNEEGVNKLGDF